MLAFEVGPADDDGDRAARLGEEQRGLAGRVAAADDDDRRRRALAGFDLGGRVVHAVAFEVVEAARRRVAGSGRRWRRSRRGRRPRSRRRGGRRGVRPAPAAPVAAHGAVRMRAELLRLDDRALGEVAAGDAGREAEVVLDPRAGAGLSADARRSRRPASAAPRTRRRRRRPVRPGRRRRRRGRSTGREGCRRSSRGTRRARPGVGRRSTAPVTITTGSSSGVTPTSRSSRSTPASWSGSSHSCGIRLRARNSRTRCDSGENREPTTRMVADAPVSSTVRRAMKAARIVSPRPGCVAITRRSVGRRHRR